MESEAGLAGETLRAGRAGALLRAARAATGLGALGSLVAGRNRPAAIVSGAALLAGSALTRFGIFEAGRASTLDPKYVVAQRARLASHGDATAPE